MKNSSYCTLHRRLTKKKSITYTACAGWLNFFFLGAGGSGIPYFSLLSAALSRYFSYSKEKQHLNVKSSHIKGGKKRVAGDLMLSWTSVSFLSNSSNSASVILDLRRTSRFFYKKASHNIITWTNKNYFSILERNLRFNFILILYF